MMVMELMMDGLTDYSLPVYQLLSYCGGVILLSAVLLTVPRTDAGIGSHSDGEKEDDEDNGVSVVVTVLHNSDQHHHSYCMGNDDALLDRLK
jgi:hypothetical protein